MVFFLIILCTFVYKILCKLEFFENNKKKEQYKILETIDRNFKDFQEIICRFQRQTQLYVIDVTEYTNTYIKVLALDTSRHVLQMYELRYTSNNFISNVKNVSKNNKDSEIFSNQTERYYC